MNESMKRELWGRNFNISQQGLDEEQVVEFVDALTQQRDSLLEQVNSLLSYIRLSKKLIGKEGKLKDHDSHMDEEETARIVKEIVQDIQTEPETKKPEPAKQTILDEVTKVAETSEKDVTLYQGEVELAIMPPINAVELFKFQRTILSSFRSKILSTDGSPSKGALITILLNEPQPLLKALKQIPEVIEATEEPCNPTDINGITSFIRNKPDKTIKITLNKR